MKKEQIPAVMSLTREHWRLLYLISLYSSPSISLDNKDRWIRKLSLQVFMYEGIVKKVFDWDYAPTSRPFLDSRLYLNITQEGEDDICDLRELGLVNSMRISTVKHRFIEVLQVSHKGLGCLDGLTDLDRHSVESLIECPVCGSRITALAKEKIDGTKDFCKDFCKDCCIIKCRDCDYERESGITDIEDVSYVSSSYIPENLSFSDTFSFENQISAAPGAEIQSLVAPGAEPQSSAGPGSETQSSAPEYDQMVSNIKDDLDELIILSNVKVLITEWIPFGTNHIASMSLKLGASERIKNAMFTQVIDHDPGGTELTVSPGLTEVYVKSEVFGETINFDASIYYPEDPGIIQVEEFGVNVSSMGRILLGLNVDKIASHSRDRVSLDHLSRLMSDIVLDSSKMLETLLTSYQKNLLSLVFMSRHLNRDKYALVICENIMPLKNVEDYLDAEGYECELKQIIEEVIDTVQLKDGFIIIGSHGTLLCSKEFKKYEPVLIDFIGVKALEIFMQNFFTSQFVLNDIIRDIKELIAKSETDPRAVENVQALLSKASGDSTLMKEIQGYLTESVQSFEKNLEKNYLSYDSKLKEISDYLKIKKSLNLLSDRIFDMEKIINGTLKSLEGLAAVTEVISERQMNRVQEALQNNTRNLEDVTRSSERTGVTMEIMEVILAGSLAFDIMDRITGEWSVMSTPDAGTWGAEYLGPLINIPGVWFLISMSLWAVIAFGLYRFMNWMQERSEPVLIARVKVNRPCSIQALNDYLYNKPVTIRDVDDYTDTLRKKVTWIENDLKKWSAREIKIELFFDEKNGFILSYLLEVPRPSGISTEIISEIFESDLIKNKVLT